MLITDMLDPQGKNCVISGGSQGLGAQLAKYLFRRGANVTIVARTEAKLKSTLEEILELRVNESQYANYIAADISQYEECSRVFHSIIPDIVLCCAGSSIPKLFLDLSPQELQSGVEINYNTALYFSHAALKRMTTSNSSERHLMLFSSVVAFYSFIGYGQYAPLKAALRSLSDVLRQECLPYNIKVDCVFPGNFMSEGYTQEEKTKPEITKLIEGPSYPIPADECCDIIFRKVGKGYSYITTDTIGWVLHSAMLGNGPREWWPLQVLLSFLISLLAPIINIHMNLKILKYFRKNKKSS